jgi:hypothetical protein
MGTINLSQQGIHCNYLLIKGVVCGKENYILIKEAVGRGIKP